MAFQEALNLPCPFVGQKRTDRIDEVAPRSHQLGTDVEKALLKPYETIEPLRRQPPAGFGVAAPSAASRARCIDQHKIGLCVNVREFRKLVRGTEQVRLD